MADAITGVAETPLQDLLRRIPRDAIYQWTTPEAEREVWQLASNSAPIGRLAHEAADRLDAAASPPAREEAPGEGAGRPDDYEGPDVGMHDTEIDDRDDDDPELPDTPETRLIYKHFCDVHCLNPDEAADATGALIEDLSALRNRTSEPEAGEAVLPCDIQIGPATFRKGVKLSLLIDAAGRWYGLASAAHPAPATADKLRAVVEGFVSDLTGGHPNARRTRLVISHDALSARIEQALATLNEQPQ